MPYQYVREPLTADESDRLCNACETPTERLVVWTLLDTGLRVGELCDLTRKNVLWQQRSSGSRARAAFTVRRPRSAWCRCPAVCGCSWSTTSRWRRRSLSRRSAPGHCFCVRNRSGIREALPHPPSAAPPRTTWAKSASRVYSMLQSKWLLRASFRALSQWSRGKEMKMIENGQNKAGFSGVCRC